MLENLTPLDKARSCKVRTVMEQLEPDDRLHLQTFLADTDTWSSNGLSKALNTRGIFVSANTIHKHRQKACAC
jgi:hypothetical protein